MFIVEPDSNFLNLSISYWAFRKPIFFIQGTPPTDAHEKDNRRSYVIVDCLISVGPASNIKTVEQFLN